MKYKKTVASSSDAQATQAAMEEDGDRVTTEAALPDLEIYHHRIHHITVR